MYILWRRTTLKAYRKTLLSRELVDAALIAYRMLLPSIYTSQVMLLHTEVRRRGRLIGYVRVRGLTSTSVHRMNIHAGRTLSLRPRRTRGNTFRKKYRRSVLARSRSVVLPPVKPASEGGAVR